MAQDRIAKYILEIGGDGSDLNAVFAGIKSRIKSDVAEIKQTTDRLELFGSISDNLPKVTQALEKAKAQITQFSAEIKKIEDTGGKAPKALTDSLAQAEKAAKSATTELARQGQQLATLDAQLTKAGVNTKQLAAEQIRLAEASKVAADAAAQTAAKQALGLTTLKDIAPEVARLRAQFDLLKNSGVLSATETAAAQKQLDAKLKELNASVTTTGGSFKSLRADVGSTFTPLLLGVTAAVGAIAAVGAALSSVTDAAKAYRNGIAQVGTVTTLGGEQLAALGGEARKLAQELGISLPDALKSLYEIIRSGVPAENSIEVLRLSALAAKAAFTETAVGAQAAGVLIDSFGLEVGQLSGALDIVTKSAQTGGPTLAEFANNAGALGNAARATGADFTDVIATLNVMTDASNDAAGSTAVLTKILINLNRPETRLALHQLGIDGRSVADIFRQLDARGLKINEFLDLGIANTKAAAGVAALINNADKLPVALNNAATAAGTLAAANARLYDTPEERKKRFEAALEETRVRLGETAYSAAGVVAGLTAALGVVNEFLTKENETNVILRQQGNDIEGLVKKLFGFKEATAATTPAIAEFHQELIAGQPVLAAAATQLRQINTDLATNAASLEKSTGIITTAIREQIAAIKERAAAEIEQLDKSTAMQVATAARTLEIRAKANADILALIKEGENQINVAVKAAIDARVDLGKKNAEGEKETAKAVSKLRLDALTADLTNYRTFQNDLIAQTRERVTAINAIEGSRVEFNRGILNAIKAITREGESGLQQFAEKQRDVERLIAEARQIAATQGIAAAEKYFKEAQGISESLKGEVVSDGVVVVSALQGQQSALGALKKVRDAYNTASQEARDKEKSGLADAEAKLTTVGQAIAALQKATTDLRKELQEGIQLQINKDIKGIAEARAQIAELVKPETKVITVVTQQAGGPAPDFVGPPAPFATGGPVRRFANGGPVFNRPSWSKVPGVGNSDTVPALLQEGSFVMRKAASQKYGDSVMGQLARGYAAGGAVSGTTAEAAAIFQYAKYILTFLRHPIFEQSRRVIGEEILLVQKNGFGNKNLMDNLRASVEFAAANFQLQDFYGKTAISGGTFGTKRLPDFEEWMRSRPVPSRFASGGRVGTDTVPAMLTPGEVVINPSAVSSIARRFGSGFLPALNAMRIPAPPIPRFASGGPVGDVPGWKPGSSGSAGIGGMTFGNIIINTPYPVDDDRTIRKLMQRINVVQARTGKRIVTK